MKYFNYFIGSLIFSLFLFSIQAQGQRFGDYSRPELIVPLGHTEPIYSMEYSPDGKYILTASADGTAKVWEAKSGKLIHDLKGHSGEVWSAHFSPDGNYIVTVSKDGLAKLWDAPSGSFMENYESNVSGYKKYDVRFHPSEKVFLINEFSKAILVFNYSFAEINQIYDLPPRRPSNQIDEPARTVLFYGKMNYLVLDDKKELKVWNSRLEEYTDTLLKETLNSSIIYSSELSQIISLDIDGVARSWDALTLEQKYTISETGQKIHHVFLSPNQKTLVTSSSSGSIKLLNAATGNLITALNDSLDMIRIVEKVRFGTDGDVIYLFDDDGKGVKWEHQSNTLSKMEGFNSLRFGGSDMGGVITALSPDAQQVIGIMFNKTPVVFDVESGKDLFYLDGHNHSFYTVDYNTKANQFTTFGGDQLGQSVRLWDSKTGDLLKTEDLTIFPASFKSDGSEVLMTDGFGSVHIYNTKTLDSIDTFDSQSFGYYSPDGNQIVLKGYTSDFKVLNATTKKALYSLSSSMDVSYSPDSKFLASYDTSGLVIRNSTTGLPVYSIKEDLNTGRVNAPYQFSPDNRFIVTVNKNDSVKVWDADTGGFLFALGQPAIKVAFSHDSKKLYTGTIESIKEWNTSDGKLIRNVEFAYNASINFSVSGRYLISYKNRLVDKIYSTDSNKVVFNGSLDCDYKIFRVVTHEDGNTFSLLHRGGALTLWDIAGKKELLSFYAIEKDDWVVTHPTGLFDASPRAMELMYYLMGREVIELEQLKERYYEPGLFRKVMAAYGTGLRNVEQFESLAMYPLVESEIKEDTLHVNLTRRSGGIGKVEVYVGGKLVLDDANLQRARSINIPLVQFARYYNYDTTNIVSIRVYNEEGWLKSSAIDHDYKPDFIKSRGLTDDDSNSIFSFFTADPKFYAIIVGTSVYSNPDLNLNFPDLDSEQIFNAIGQTAKLLFNKEDDKDNVHLNWFTSDVAKHQGSSTGTKESIKAIFDQLKTTVKVNDVVMVYFAGHGTTYTEDGKEQFYYLTKDITSDVISDPDIRKSYTISTAELTTWLNELPAQKQVLILDACYSGKVVDGMLGRDVPTAQTRALDRMKDRTGVFVLAGSAADKKAYEASPYGGGLLTHSLMMGMNRGALKENQYVDVMALFQYAMDRVPLIAKKHGIDQKPTLAAPLGASSFDIGLVDDTTVIEVTTIKHIFRRTILQEQNEFHDVLGLSGKMDNFLKNQMSEELIFLDDFKGAYSILGRYEVGGEDITLNIKLFKNDEKVSDFPEAFKGKTTAPNDLIFEVLNAVIQKVNAPQ